MCLAHDVNMFFFFFFLTDAGPLLPFLSPFFFPRVAMPRRKEKKTKVLIPPRRIKEPRASQKGGKCVCLLSPYRFQRLSYTLSAHLPSTTTRTTKPTSTRSLTFSFIPPPHLPNLVYLP